MEYALIFLEGIASFISPCLLPMIPIYIAYFAGENGENSKKTFVNSLGFVLGFSAVFLLMAIFASKLGSFISENMKYLRPAFGLMIIVFGLNYMELFNIKILNNASKIKADIKDMNFFKSLVFGIMFSISWTPCIGTFLGSALLLIAKNQDLVKGILLISIYSIGLGIPFLASALLIKELKNVFNVVKRNYSLVRKISGVLLIIMGIYTMFA